MNQDPSIFPDIKLFNVRENLQKAVVWTAGMLAAGRTTELCLSEHNRGAEVMLTEHLDLPEQLESE